VQLADGSFRPRSPSPAAAPDPAAQAAAGPPGAAMRAQDAQMVLVEEEEEEEVDEDLLPWHARKALLRKQADEAALELQRFEVGTSGRACAWS
jgi:hypothetical protein